MREACRKTAYDVDKRERELAVSRRQWSRSFHILMWEACRKLAVRRRQWSRVKSTVEHETSVIERGTLHCGNDVQRRQRRKEKSDVEGTTREIGLCVLLCICHEDRDAHLQQSRERSVETDQERESRLQAKHDRISAQTDQEREARLHAIWNKYQRIPNRKENNIT